MKLRHLRGLTLKAALLASLIVIIGIVAFVRNPVEVTRYDIGPNTDTEQSAQTIVASDSAPVVQYRGEADGEDPDEPMGEGDDLNLAALSDSNEPSSVTQTANLPFTPRGDAAMVGRWGRNMAGLINGDADLAKFTYAEYQFDKDGSFTINGYRFGESYNQKGVYRVENDKLLLCATGELKNDKWEPYSRLETTEGKIYRDSDGDKFDIDVRYTFNKGVWWDFNSEPQGYRDERNTRLSTAKDSVTGLFPYDSGEFKITAEVSGKRIIRLTITPFHHFFGPQDGEDYITESRIQSQAAEAWLAKKGIPKSIPRVIKEDA